jgi:hypothetical protein
MYYFFYFINTDIILLIIVGLMEFNPSVDDDERYSQVIARWFLNALNKMSDGKTWKRFRKIDVFKKASKSHLGGFMGDRKELGNYLGKKGSNAYSDLIDPVVKFLVNKEFMKRAVNTAEIVITEEGVTMCNKEGPTGRYFQDYPIE